MADGWLQRVLAVDPCSGCGRLAGEMCVREDEADDGVAMVCASRIQAAEGAAGEPAKPDAEDDGDYIGDWHGDNDTRRP